VRAFESYGLVLREWDEARMDWVMVREHLPASVELG
jgi:hypothetical protein